MTQTYKYLHFVTLQSLVNWSVAHLLNSDIGFTKHYPFVKIGDVIHRKTTLVSIEDKTRELIREKRERVSGFSAFSSLLRFA